MSKNYPPIAIFGLGRMGAQIAARLKTKGFSVYTWNRSPEPVVKIKRKHIFGTSDVEDIINRMDNSEKKSNQRIFWLMLPHSIVDQFLNGPAGLGPYLKKGDIVIDGGNSFYKDTIRRAGEMQAKGVRYFDCGTSGGIWGEKNGFALMVGGPKTFWSVIKPYIRALSSGDNYAYCGRSGAGHFVKMVHNGIEYGMMEAIGEGYAVLKSSPFNLKLNEVTRVYQKGSVIRSWLIDLCRDIFEEEDVDKVAGEIDSNGEGEWTVNAGHEFGVDVRVIEDSVNVRRESTDPKNRDKYSNKIVALLRKRFGGHAIHGK